MGKRGLRLAGCSFDVVSRTTRSSVVDEFIGEDFSYGPLIHFTPGLVRDLAAQMAAVTADDLTRMLDLDELQAAGAYPEIWDRPEEAEDNRAWVLSEASAVAQLYRLAAQNGHGVTTLIG